MEKQEKNQARIDWLKDRRKGIGGSDVAAILGLSQYKTPLQVYLEKIGTGEPEDIQTSEAAEWGNRLESAVAQKFAENHPDFSVVENATGIHQSKNYPFMLATPDRFVNPTGNHLDQTILECKTASIRLLPAWEAGEIPDAYMLQVQHYMAVLDLDSCWLACLVGGQRYFEFEVERNQEIIDGLIKHESDFWKMVENRTPPAVSAGDSKLIDILYPTKPGETVSLPEKVVEEIHLFEEAKLNMKAAEEEKELRANKIKELMAGAELGIVGKYKVSWKEQTQNRIDSDALKKQFPQIVPQVSKTISFRKFEVREMK